MLTIFAKEEKSRKRERKREVKRERKVKLGF